MQKRSLSQPWTAVMPSLPDQHILCLKYPYYHPFTIIPPLSAGKEFFAVSTTIVNIPAISRNSIIFLILFFTKIHPKIFCIIHDCDIQKKIVIFSTDKNRALTKNIIKLYGVCAMENNEKNNCESRMESASDVRADIKKDFDEQDPDAKSTLVGGKMIKKMIERKATE